MAYTWLIFVRTKAPSPCNLSRTMHRLIFLAFAATASCQSINELFTVDAATCNGINLDDYLNDARILLTSAQTGISSLKSAKTFFGGSNNRHYMRNAANAFGTTYYSAANLNGISSADSATVSEASGTSKI